MIYFFGDSFTYGDELSDRNCAWPFLLGQMLDCPVTNFGVPGASNEYIIRKTLEKLDEGNPELVFLSWTDCNRREFYKDTLITTNTSTAERFDFVKHYYSDWHDSLHSFSNWACQVRTMRGYLESLNIPYWFTCSLGNKLVWEQYQDSDEFEKWNKQIVDKKFIGWPQQDFIDWTATFPLAPGGHPLEQGHKNIAEKIYEYIRN